MPAIEGTTAEALAKLQAKIDADPEIQTLLKSNAAQIQATHDKGGDARKFQNSLRDRITQIAKQKGYLPTTDQVFINPNDGKLEGHGGWAGLNTATKIAIIAAAGATGVGGAAALGAFGGGAAATGGGFSAAGSTGGVGSGASILTGAGTQLALPTVAGTSGVTAAGAGGTGILGALGKYGKVASKVAPILGAATNARGEAQVNQERAQLSRDQLDLSAANSKATNEMNQKQYQLAAPGQRLNTGLKASMAANATGVKAGAGAPVTLGSGNTTTPIHFGGLDAGTLIGDKGRQLSNSVLDQELEQQLSGTQDKFAPFDYDKAQPAPQSGFVDKALSGGATAAGILGAVGAASPTLNSILTKAKSPATVKPYNPEDDPFYIDPRGV